MNRYLEVLGEGALNWLGSPPATAAQRVYASLLREPCSVALEPARLADRIGLSVPDFSKALFELSRHRSLAVTLESHDHSDEFGPDFEQLRADLERTTGAQVPAMVVGEDGLCLIQQGLDEEAGIEQAASCHQEPPSLLPRVMLLHLGTHQVRLCTPEDTVIDGNGLLRMTRRLSRMLA